MIEDLFFQAVDVLLLRGNKLFGDAGSFGGALMPPWPSIAAGALRSRMLADAKVDLSAFARGEPVLGNALHRVLGSPAAPGSFRIAHFGLARREAQGKAEPLFPLPADVVVPMRDDPGTKSTPLRMTLRELPGLLRGSYPLPRLPVLEQTELSKADSGYFFTFAGWAAYLEGETLEPGHIIHRNQLWQSETRVGVAVQEDVGTVREGALFSAEAVNLKHRIGFCARVAGADGQLPRDGLLRFGGDGRAVTIHMCALDTPRVPYLVKGQRFKFVLTSPGLFADGWRLPGIVQENGHWLWRGPEDLSAELVAAAVPRAETISGWDLAGLHQPQRDGKPRRWGPKPAQKVAPTGSVYWFENLQGDPAALGKLAESGLWGLPGQNDDPLRRAEGFNNVAIGDWTA